MLCTYFSYYTGSPFSHKPFCKKTSFKPSSKHVSMHAPQIFQFNKKIRPGHFLDFNIILCPVLNELQTLL